VYIWEGGPSSNIYTSVKDIILFCWVCKY
jgi:hypothetical protein